jgi:hypothetical protein
MFSRVEINGFRTFRRLVVDNLKRVNLFVGKNNAGKTSLLEALEILAIGMPWGLWRSPTRRGEDIIPIGEDDRPAARRDLDVAHLFFGHTLDKALFSIFATNHPARSVDCRVVTVPKDDDIVRQEELPSVEAQARLPSLGQTLAVRFQSAMMSGPVLIPLSPEGGLPFEAQRGFMPSPQEELPKVGFLRPETSDMLRLSLLWDRVVLTPEEGKVIALYHGICNGLSVHAAVSCRRRSAVAFWTLRSKYS